jgi:hypothetical protein
MYDESDLLQIILEIIYGWVCPPTPDAGKCADTVPLVNIQFPLVLSANNTCVSMHLTCYVPFFNFTVFDWNTFLLWWTVLQAFIFVICRFKKGWGNENSCVLEQPISSALHFCCYLVLCSIWHLQLHSHIVSLGKLSHYFISSGINLYNLYSEFFCFVGGTAKRVHIIHGWSLCRVVQCGLDILEVFENPCDLLQSVIIHTHLLYGFLLFSM